MYYYVDEIEEKQDSDDQVFTDGIFTLISKFRLFFICISSRHTSILLSFTLDFLL